MASQITKNMTMTMTLRRLLLAIWLYMCRILRHVGIPTLERSVKLNVMPQPASWLSVVSRGGTVSGSRQAAGRLSPRREHPSPAAANAGACFRFAGKRERRER